MKGWESTHPEMRLMRKDLVEATNLDFEDEHEEWNTYKLNDGTTLKIKLILKYVKRLQKHGRNGKPIYLIASETVTRKIKSEQT